jgi:N-acetylmuramoyl-L-alanine amidase
MDDGPDEINVYKVTYNTTIQETKCLETKKPIVKETKKSIVKETKKPIVKETKNNGINYKDNKDINLLAHIINAEAGNQPYNGKLAVGTVIMNRVESTEFPDSIKDVIYQRGQFSPVSNGTINNKPSKESIEAAKEIILRGKRVFGKDILFFYEPSIATDEWIRTRKAVMKIGDHVFAL